MDVAGRILVILNKLKKSGNSEIIIKPILIELVENYHMLLSNLLFRS